MTARGRPQGVWRGKVHRVDGNHAWVRIPRYSGARVYGPCDVYLPPAAVATSIGATSALTGTASGHQHTVSVVPLTEGDDVLVAFVEGRADDVVVIGVRR
jgi:hypothetical protein